jgi:hypothetical protein
MIKKVQGRVQKGPRRTHRFSILLGTDERLLLEMYATGQGIKAADAIRMWIRTLQERA